MALLVQDGFNGVADGTSLTAANTTASTVSGAGVLESDTAIVLEGSGALLVNAEASIRTLIWTLSSRSNTYFSCYFRLPSAPANNSFLVVVRNGANSADAAQIGFTTTPELRIRNGTTQVDITSGLTLNEWHRIDWELLGAGDQTAWLYKGANLHSTNTANAWDTITGALTSTNFANLNFGNPVAVTGGWTCSADWVQLDDATMPTPLTSAPTEVDHTYFRAGWRRTLGLQ